MFQWDAIDTSPDVWSQNVITTFEMAIPHKKRTTRTELERALCRWIYFHLRSKILFCLSYRGRLPHRPPWICHWSKSEQGYRLESAVVVVRPVIKEDSTGTVVACVVRTDSWGRHQQAETDRRRCSALRRHHRLTDVDTLYTAITTSRCSNHSERSHRRCCHLPNNFGSRRECQLCRVASNTVWSHMARVFP